MNARKWDASPGIIGLALIPGDGRTLPLNAGKWDASPGIIGLALIPGDGRTPPLNARKWDASPGITGQPWKWEYPTSMPGSGMPHLE